MVTPAFGFSAGDFIAAINLVITISKSLRDSNGASVEINSLLLELHQLQLVLEQLRDLPPESSPTLSHVNALRGMALTVQIPLQDFLGKMEKYKAAAKVDSTSSRWSRAGRKIKWAVIMQEDVTRLRAIVTMKIVSISLLMAIPTGQTLHRIHQSAVENRDVIDSSRKDLREAKIQLSEDINKTRLQVRSTERTISLDTRRLLKICVGLRVGIERLEGDQCLARERKQQDLVILRAISTTTAQIETSVNSLQLSISLIGVVVQQLLRSFSSFSKDVIEQLKQLHFSNMEIYLLLRRISENIPRRPSGILADDIRFVDVLQREWRLPYAIFCDYEIFERMLQCKFKGFPGESKVRMGEYHIMNTKAPYQIISRQDWSRQVFPGSSIDMSILLLALRSSGERCPKSSCPGIGALESVYIGVFTMISSACNLQYFPIEAQIPVGHTAQKINYSPMLAINIPTLRPMEERIPKPTTLRPLSGQERTSDPARDWQSQDQSEPGIGVNENQESERAREIEELSVFRKVHVRVDSEQQQLGNGDKGELPNDHSDNESRPSDIRFVEIPLRQFQDEWDRMAYQSSKSIGVNLETYDAYAGMLPRETAPRAARDQQFLSSRISNMNLAALG